jgi:hypothetical protein
MARKRTRASIDEPAEPSDAATAGVRGTAETIRTNVGSAVPASRQTGSDEFLLRQILAELQRPSFASAVPAIRQTGSDESLLLRQILEELEGMNQRLEQIEHKLA